MLLLELFSREFEHWFEGSKVVDKNGAPLLCYHGTPVAYDEFSASNLGDGNDSYGAGYYFTISTQTAHGYSEPKPESSRRPNGKPTPEVSPNIRPCYLAIKKPLIVSNEGSSGKDIPINVIRKLIMSAPNLDDTLTNFGDVSYEGRNSVLKSAIDAYSGQEYLRGLNMIGNDFYDKELGVFLDNCIKFTPYDGVIIPFHDFYVAWSPKQIRSYFESQDVPVDWRKG